ncbi:type II toxin-antitoxin system RelB/DinJ family antitoxin [Edwardsiella tarda]|uniref:Damage-inducible protein J n=1 Tax=Edwardsiella tarda TaxID=636 RepID=A0A2S1PML2_EDWTA|nr:hypothetical protein [Edwardsiella tarda]
METRIQFRIEKETKKLAMQALERKGISLSDALRKFINKLAAGEKTMTKEDTWLKEQIEDTFKNIESGDVRYYSEDEANKSMQDFIDSMEKSHSDAA